MAVAFVGAARGHVPLDRVASLGALPRRCPIPGGASESSIPTRGERRGRRATHPAHHRTKTPPPPSRRVAARTASCTAKRAHLLWTSLTPSVRSPKAPFPRSERSDVARCGEFATRPMRSLKGFKIWGIGVMPLRNNCNRSRVRDGGGDPADATAHARSVVAQLCALSTLPAEERLPIPRR